MILSWASAGLYLLLLLTVFSAAAQPPANAQIKVDIGRDDTLARTFLLTNAVNCPGDRYRFLLTPDSDFVSLPVDTIELSRANKTSVRILFNSSGLEPGIHTANITVSCRDCLRYFGKTLRRFWRRLSNVLRRRRGPRPRCHRGAHRRHRVYGSLTNRTSLARAQEREGAT